MGEKPRAFVIMPFDAEFKSIYEKLIKTSLEEVGYDVTRADSFIDQQNILSSIVQGITMANVIIADLTTTNANVFYELGLCHGVGVPVILIAQSINDVPFDLRSYRVHVYDTHFDKIGKLRDFLKDIGRRHQADEVIFSNPIRDFSTAVTSSEAFVHEVSIANDAPTGDSKKQVDDLEPKELLDFMVDANRATEDLNQLLNELLKANAIVTNKISKHTGSMQLLSNNPTAGSARRFHKISLLAASDINKFSQTVEDMLPRFEDTVERLSENYSGYLELVDLQTEKNHESILHFRVIVNQLLDGAKEARRGFHLYRDAAVELGTKKISKDLTRAARRQAEALAGVISNIERVEAFCSNTLAIIEARFGSTVSLTEVSA